MKFVVFAVCAVVGVSSLGMGAVVSFPDPGLNAAVRAAIEKPTGDILTSDLTHLTYLEALSGDISDLTGIESCTSLTVLNLSYNRISDLSPLSGLTGLVFLSLLDNQVSDITPLAGLVNMERLWLSYNNISSIAAVSGMTKLNELLLEDNPVSDLSPLAGLTSLTALWARPSINSLAPLAGLINLRQLLINGNFPDLRPLSGLVNLQQLSLDQSNIINISPLAGLTNLEWLTLSENQIWDLRPLSGMNKLIALALGHNQITNVSPLASLTALKFLSFEYNQVSNLSPLSGLVNLRHLNLYSNYVSSLAPLVSLTNLELLTIGRNSVTDIGPLVQNLGLGVGDEIWLEGNPFNDMYCPQANQLVSRGAWLDYAGACSFRECALILTMISRALAYWANSHNELPLTMDSWNTGIPDAYEMALLDAVLCRGDAEVTDVFTRNRANILASPAYVMWLDEGAWFAGVDYADFFAGLATVDGDAIYNLQGMGFEDLTSLDRFWPLNDLDDDGVLNIEEYQHVAERGGSPQDYARAALSPQLDGTPPPMPAASVPALAALTAAMLVLGLAAARLAS